MGKTKNVARKPEETTGGRTIMSAEKILSEAAAGHHTASEGGYEMRILQSLRLIIRAIEIYSRKLAHDHQITGPQLGCLLAILEEGPLLATRLAKKVHLSPSTVVGIVDRLEKKGLITRERISHDRRQIHIAVTEAGRRAAMSAPSPVQERLSQALKNLPELERVSIVLALEKVVDLMEAGRIDASPAQETAHIGF
jgi:DNA-binding MarR family transcriptional regulator